MVCLTWSLYGLSLEFFLLWLQPQENCVNFEANQPPSCNCCNYPYCRWLVILVPVYLVFLNTRDVLFRRKLSFLVLSGKNNYIYLEMVRWLPLESNPDVRLLYFTYQISISVFSDLFLCFICFNSFILFLSLSLVSLATYVCDHCYGQVMNKVRQILCFLPSFHRNQVRERMSNRPVPIPVESI